MAANDNLYGSKVGTYSSGGVITHTLFNTEFNAIANSFHATDGHNHDGTAGAGAPISKLNANAITIGDNSSATISVTFDSTSSNGVFTWYGSGYFLFADDIIMSGTEQVKFRDSNQFINSSTAGQLDISATTLIKTSGGLATTPVTLTGAGGALAVDITESQMFLNTGSGTTTLTMATGADGQQMRITMEVAGNNATMSASDGNLVTSQASSITWDAVGESVDFVYSASLSKWLIVNVHGATLS